MYSPETMERMERSIRVATVKKSDLGDDWTAEAHVEPPRIEDTCCGSCPGASCYVDYLTGERS